MEFSCSIPRLSSTSITELTRMNVPQMYIPILFGEHRAVHFSSPGRHVILRSYITYAENNGVQDSSGRYIARKTDSPVCANRTHYTWCVGKKSCAATPKATACYVAQSSRTSTANIIDCTREREDKRACDERKRKIYVHRERETEGGKEREREKESLRRVARATRSAGRKRGRRRGKVGGTPRLIHPLCTLLQPFFLFLVLSFLLFVLCDSRLETSSVNAGVFPPCNKYAANSS